MMLDFVCRIVFLEESGEKKVLTYHFMTGVRQGISSLAIEAYIMASQRTPPPPPELKV